MPRVDILVADGDATYWGSLLDVSRTGVAITLRQGLPPNQKVTIRFRLESDDGTAAVEDLTATVIWQHEDHAGLEFIRPLIVGSSALKKAPRLAAHLDKKKSER